MITVTLEFRLLENKIKTGDRSVAEGTTISELLLSNGLKWEQIPHLTVLVDGKYVDLGHQLKDGNFVRVLPLLEGG
ncbi:MoaD/ThiS family protein [Desulfotomaculum sp. 1211_IL3151]|uniref:MoaD/ThiS family protein n=1 Tax=Desulfotomaculum sp. 1211_IL3151 TaxID=3084055 RepID=UPI002FD91D3C